jgi:hypothetical protein
MNRASDVTQVENPCNLEVLVYGHSVARATAWQIVSMRYMGPLACDGTGSSWAPASVASVPGGAGDGAAFSGGERVRMAGAECALARFQQRIEDRDRFCGAVVLDVGDAEVVRGPKRVRMILAEGPLEVAEQRLEDGDRRAAPPIIGDARARLWRV